MALISMHKGYSAGTLEYVFVDQMLDETSRETSATRELSEET